MSLPPVFACLALTVSALAQTSTFIVPSRLSDPSAASTATHTGGDTDYFSFWHNSPALQPVRVQHLWPVGDINLAAANLLSVAFRRPNHLASANPPATAACALVLSVGPNTVAGHSTTFAANHGAGSVTVFNGTLVLPGDPQGTGTALFRVLLPFSTPFPFVAAMGNTLVAELTVTAYAPTSPLGWVLDAVGADLGLRTTNHYNSTCRFSNGQVNNSIGYISPVLGGNWFVSYQGGLPPGLPAAGILGFTGVGGNWNGIPLPLALGPFGAPNCVLATSMVLLVPLSESPAGVYSWPNLLLPNDPALVDGSFYDQGLFADLGANALGLVTGWSSKWTVRTGNRPLGGRLWSYTNQGAPFPSPTTGFWSELSATIAQFTH